MHPQAYKDLLRKYMRNTCTNEELAAVRLFFQRPDAQQLFEELLEEEEGSLKQQEADPVQMQAWKDAFQQRRKMGMGKALWRQMPMKLLRVAAVFLLMAGGSWLAYRAWLRTADSSGGGSIATVAAQTRFIQLPDGTKVILKGNSTLTYDASFNEHTRELTLVGEAYFDVRSNAARPFIIHTGKLNTRVLGTAFNINAQPGEQQIVVTVTQGKVQVEENEKIVATLTADEQASYNKQTTVIKEVQVKATETVVWVKQDMAFEEASFRSITEQLSQRYNVQIKFASPDIANCLITASFKGAETLEEVLDVLCITRNASYTRTGDSILINGKGCE